MLPAAVVVGIAVWREQGIWRALAAGAIGLVTVLTVFGWYLGLATPDQQDAWDEAQLHPGGPGWVKRTAIAVAAVVIVTGIVMLVPVSGHN